MSKAKKMDMALFPAAMEAAEKQWSELKRKRAIAILAGLFLVPICILLSKYREHNRFGERSTPYQPQFTKASKDGWAFFCIPPTWHTGSAIQRYLWNFGNDEDGYLGDRRGYWSHQCDGNERSFWNMFKWAALRNPANNFSRYTDDFACLPNNCTIQYWGDYESPDDHPPKLGWHLVRATDTVTGRVFYGFRRVMIEGGQLYNESYGFKLKPSHADEVQSPDDAHKGFTYRKTRIELREGEVMPR